MTRPDPARTSQRRQRPRPRPARRLRRRPRRRVRPPPRRTCPLTSSTRWRRPASRWTLTRAGSSPRGSASGWDNPTSTTSSSCRRAWRGCSRRLPTRTPTSSWPWWRRRSATLNRGSAAEKVLQRIGRFDLIDSVRTGQRCVGLEPKFCRHTTASPLGGGSGGVPRSHIPSGTSTSITHHSPNRRTLPGMGRHTIQPEDETVDKVREHRLCRMAKRQGFVLLKSRPCDPLALDCGPYGLVDAGHQKIDFGLTLQQVEEKIDFGLTVQQVEQVLSEGQPKPDENV